MLVVKSLDRVARALHRLVPNEGATFAKPVPVPDDVDVDQRAKGSEHGPVVLFVRGLGCHPDEELFLLVVGMALLIVLLFGGIKGQQVRTVGAPPPLQSPLQIKAV